VVGISTMIHKPTLSARELLGSLESTVSRSGAENGRLYVEAHSKGPSNMDQFAPESDPPSNVSSVFAVLSLTALTRSNTLRA
jgi:hypothetical protein